MAVCIGRSKNKEVHIDMAQNVNGHILITGGSGTGKTNFLKHYLNSAASDYISILDYSGSFTDFVGTGRLDICASSVLRDFFQDLSDKTIGMVAASLQGTFRLGPSQKSTLLKALFKMRKPLPKSKIEPVCEESVFFPYLSEKEDLVKADWAMLAFILDTQCGPEGKALATRFFEVVTVLYAKVLIDDEREGVMILDFSPECSGISSYLVELYLWRVWFEQIKVCNSAEHKEVILVLDECQNLNWRKGSIAEKMLSEGRKFGISLILSTQFMSDNFPRRVITSFTQSGVRVIFAPPESEIIEIAKSLDTVSWRNWVKSLRNLRKGHCIVCGAIKVGERTSRQKVVVEVPLYA